MTKAQTKVNARRMLRAAKFRMEAAMLPHGFDRNVAISAARHSVEWARETRLAAMKQG